MTEIDIGSPTLGAAIRQAREAAGLTLRGLGAQVDADFTYLSKIENGHDTPSLALVERIEAATGTSWLVALWRSTRCPSCGRPA